MTAGQFRSLLEALAHLSGLADASSLLERGRVRIGEWVTELEHDPWVDESVLNLRVWVGEVPLRDAAATRRALLESNYANGYGGDCIFALVPGTDQAVVSFRLPLAASMTAQDLWQQMSDAARHGAALWEQAT